MTLPRCEMGVVQQRMALRELPERDVAELAIFGAGTPKRSSCSDRLVGHQIIEGAPSVLSMLSSTLSDPLAPELFPFV